MESILFWAPAIYILLSTVYIIYLHKKIYNMTIELDVYDIKVDELKKTADGYKQQLDTLKEETENSYDNLYDITSETLKKISDNRDEIYNAYIKTEDELYTLQEKIIQSFILMRSIDYKGYFESDDEVGKLFTMIKNIILEFPIRDDIKELIENRDSLLENISREDFIRQQMTKTNEK